MFGLSRCAGGCLRVFMFVRVFSVNVERASLLNCLFGCWFEIIFNSMLGDVLRLCVCLI